MEPLTLAALAGGAKLAEMGFDAWGDYEARKAEREAANIRRRAIDEGVQIGTQAYDEFSRAQEPQAGMFIGDLANWRGALSQEPVQMGQFDESQYSIDRYMDPAVAYRQDQERRALNAQAAVTGNLFSGATAKALQDRSQQIASQEYGNAFGRMQGERAFGYGQFTDRFRAAREAASEKIRNLSGLLESSGAARQNQINAAMDAAQMRSSGAMQKAGVTAQNYEQGGRFTQNMLNQGGRALGQTLGAVASYGAGGFNGLAGSRGFVPQGGGAGVGDQAGGFITTNTAPDFRSA